jgi:hypothetical protein
MHQVNRIRQETDKYGSLPITVYCNRLRSKATMAAPVIKLVINVRVSYCKVPVILPDFNQTSNFR